MIKHGSSHGLAVLVCTVVSALLVELLGGVFPALHERAIVLCSQLVADFNLPIEPGSLATLLIAVLLGVLWGIAFRYAFKN